MTLKVVWPVHASIVSWHAPVFAIRDSKTCAAHLVQAFRSHSTAETMQFSELIARQLLKDCNEKRRELDTGRR
jgi:hypothetical protein